MRYFLYDTSRVPFEVEYDSFRKYVDKVDFYINARDGIILFSMQMTDEDLKNYYEPFAFIITELKQ